jgi:hypothetical protein
VKDRYEKNLDAYEDKLDEYLQKQAAIASTLTSSWPDDVHQRLMGICPIDKLWNALCNLAENQSVLAETDPLALLSINYTGDEGEDVLLVMDTFVKKRNEYVAAGDDLPDEIYAAFLIKLASSTLK